MLEKNEKGVQIQKFIDEIFKLLDSEDRQDVLHDLEKDLGDDWDSFLFNHNHLEAVQKLLKIALAMIEESARGPTDLHMSYVKHELLSDLCLEN